MSSSIVIVLVVVLGLVAAAIMRARANSRLKPVLDAAARKHTAKIQHSFLGMPQLIKHVGGHYTSHDPDEHIDVFTGGRGRDDLC